MSLKKFALSSIAIVVALYITTSLYLMINYFLISKSLTYLFQDIEDFISPLYRDFRYAYLACAIINLPLFLVFSSWGKNNLRKILVPCIILGLLFSQLQFISWWAPKVSGIQVFKGFLHGAFRYFIFYGTYWLVIRVMQRIGKAKLNGLSE